MLWMILVLKKLQFLAVPYNCHLRNIILPTQQCMWQYYNFGSIEEKVFKHKFLLLMQCFSLSSYPCCSMGSMQSRISSALYSQVGELSKPSSPLPYVPPWMEVPRMTLCPPSHQASPNLKEFTAMFFPCTHCPVVCMYPLWPPLSQMLAGPQHVPRNLLVGVMHFLTNLNLEGKIRSYETIHVTETTARLFYQRTDQGCHQLGTPSSFHFFVDFWFFYYVRSVLLCIAVFG